MHPLMGCVTPGWRVHEHEGHRVRAAVHGHVQLMCGHEVPRQAHAHGHHEHLIPTVGFTSHQAAKAAAPSGTNACEGPARASACGVQSLWSPEPVESRACGVQSLRSQPPPAISARSRRPLPGGHGATAEWHGRVSTHIRRSSHTRALTVAHTSVAQGRRSPEWSGGRQWKAVEGNGRRMEDAWKTQEGARQAVRRDAPRAAPL